MCAGAAVAAFGVSAVGLEAVISPSPEHMTGTAAIRASDERKANASFSFSNTAVLGQWSADVKYNSLSWVPGASINFTAVLHLSSELVAAITGTTPKVDQLCILVTAERDFDYRGLQHGPWNEQTSTLLTPASSWFLLDLEWSIPSAHCSELSSKSIQ